MKDIIKGHYFNLTNQNDELRNKRMAVCNECPLFDRGWCNSNLYMNEEGMVADVKLPGFTQGCGCYLDAKTRIKDQMCPLKKW